MSGSLFALYSDLLERALLFSLVSGSIHISSRVLCFDNLSIDGAFGIGGAITAWGLLYALPPSITIVASVLAGAMTGVITVLLHSKLHLNSLMSGVIVTTALFSIILTLTGSTLILGAERTLIGAYMPWGGQYTALAAISLIVGACIALTQWILKTKMGYLLYAAGTCPQMIINIGMNPVPYKMVGISLANMLAALAGSLFVHYTGYFSIWSSVGILVIGLAGMTLSQMISSQFGSSLIFGSLVYQTIITLALECKVHPDWNKLITAGIVVIVLILQNQMNHGIKHTLKA